MPHLKIGNIRPEMRDIEATGLIVSKSEKKEVTTRYGSAAVCQATLKDETGSIRLNLWRGQVDAVNIGDTIRLLNAFVKTFGQTMELNVGSNGRIEVTNRSGETK